MRVFPRDVATAVKILGDLVSNPLLHPTELELLKDAVSEEHELAHHCYE